MIPDNGHTEEEIDGWDDFFDLTDFEVPKVSFVEAVEINRHWAQPIYPDMLLNGRKYFQPLGNSEPLRDNDLEWLTVP